MMTTSLGFANFFEGFWQTPVSPFLGMGMPIVAPCVPWTARELDHFVTPVP